MLSPAVLLLVVFAAAAAGRKNPSAFVLTIDPIALGPFDGLG